MNKEVYNMDQIEIKLAELQTLINEIEAALKQLRKLKKKLPELEVSKLIDQLKEIKVKTKDELNEITNSLVSLAEAIADVEDF